MKIVFFFIYGILAFQWFGCTPKTVSTQLSYSEDLQHCRPRIDTLPTISFQIEDNSKEIVEVKKRVPIKNGEMKVIDTAINQLAVLTYHKYPKYSGYRIQVYSGMDLDLAKKTQEELNKLIYGKFYEKSNIKYEQPYYRLKAGFYFSKDQAFGLLKLIRTKFPDALIVPDEIDTKEIFNKYLR